MTSEKKKKTGCGCSNIPFSVILLALGAGYWWFSQDENRNFSQYFPKDQTLTIPVLNRDITLNPSVPKRSLGAQVGQAARNQQAKTETSQSRQSKADPESPKSQPSLPHVGPTPIKRADPPRSKTLWEKKKIRGIYLSRYQITNRASEQTIRERVRYYRAQGINTIIHGVWGNACTMYNSTVMKQTLGFKSCPNKFRAQWLDWLIDEAHKQGMEVHAYFEKGIKIDKNSPIFDKAIAKKWLVPGVDRTYLGIDHYVLDIAKPEVANFFKNILVEFVEKYPTIDAVQWDDYLGYHAELPGKVDRTDSLTKFVQTMIRDVKTANSNVSFDLCHHNPYWSKRYFAADWKNWDVDRVFIQAYNEANFQKELEYIKASAGIAITDQQFHRLPEILKDTSIKSVLVFPLSGNPEQTAAKLHQLVRPK